MGVHWEIWLLRGGVHEKPIYRQEFTKRASWTVCKFKGGLVKKGVGFLRGEWYPNAHYEDLCWEIQH